MFTSIKINEKYLYRALTADSDKLLPVISGSFKGTVKYKGGKIFINNHETNIILTRKWLVHSEIYIKKNIFVIDSVRRNKFLIFKFNYKCSQGIVVKGQYYYRSKNYIYFSRDRDQVYDLWSYHIKTGKEEMVLLYDNFNQRSHYFLKDNILTFNTEMFKKDCKRFIKGHFTLSCSSLFNYVRYKFFKDKISVNKNILKTILVPKIKSEPPLGYFNVKPIQVNFLDESREILNLKLVELNSKFINDQIEDGNEIFLNIKAEDYASLEFLYYIKSVNLYDKVSKLMC